MKKILSVLLSVCLLAATLFSAASGEADGGLAVFQEVAAGDDAVAEVDLNLEDWRDDAPRSPEDGDALLVEAAPEESDSLQSGGADGEIIPNAIGEGSTLSALELPDPDEVVCFAPEEEFATIESPRDSDELFAVYFHRMLGGASSRSPLRNAGAIARENLAGQDLFLYDQLKAEIIKVAAGERSSTRFEVPVSALLGQTRFTASELGVDMPYPKTTESSARLKAAFYALYTYSLDIVTDALWADCPYELYWLDWYDTGISTSKPGYYLTYDYEAEDYAVYVGDDACVTFKFPVLERYAGADKYTVDTSLIATAKAAQANAAAIVKKYADCSDYVRLYAYAMEICGLTDYNDDAAGDDWDLKVQDPWKLIWVFDGDPDTNVVCEGYAQAFQYLCELTDFEGGVRGRLVTGFTYGEGHGWNVVRMDDGQNYLVDVTWMEGDWDGRSDSLADLISGEVGDLFLCGGSGSVSEGYEIYGRSGRSRGERTYRDDTLSLYPASSLALAGGKYVLGGWQTISGSLYYFDDGRYVTGAREIDGSYYQFDENTGALLGAASGWQTIGGKRYFFEADGTLHTAHTAVTDAAVPATCTQSGLTAGSHCAVCGTVLTAQTVVPALGHTAVAEPAVPATCTTSGLTAGSHCAVCNAVLAKQTIVPAKGHSAVNDPAVPATCTTNGMTAGSHCSACGLVFVAQTILPAPGHSAVKDPAVPATCTESGLTEGWHCSVCKAVLAKQAVVPAKGHSAVADPAVPATYTRTGLTAGSHCGVCGTVLVKQTVVPVLDCTFHMRKNATKKVNVGDPIQIAVDGATAASYKSSDKKVASVNAKGRVTAKAAGTAKITIALTNKKKLTLTVVVADPDAPKSVKIAQGKSAALKAGQKLALTAVLTPAAAKTSLKWTTSNKKVAAVSSKGVVTAKKKGSAKITVATANGKKATIKITVK